MARSKSQHNVTTKVILLLHFSPSNVSVSIRKIKWYFLITSSHNLHTHAVSNNPANPPRRIKPSINTFFFFLVKLYWISFLKWFDLRASGRLHTGCWEITRNARHAPQFVMLYLNVSNWSLFFTALCATILLFFLPATRRCTRVSSRGSFQRSGVFVTASWLNGRLLFASIHGESGTMTVPELLLGLRGDQRPLIRTLPQLQLSTRCCLHSCVSGCSSCAICTWPSLSRSPCSFVASDLSALSSLLAHFLLFWLRSVWALGHIWWFFFRCFEWLPEFVLIVE